MRHSSHLSATEAENLSRKIGEYPDYPKPGILFRDATPLLADVVGFNMAIKAMCAPYRAAEFTTGFANEGMRPTHIAGVESRGFIFGAAMAALLGVAFVPIRKHGAKLPGTLHEESYALEYGHATLVCQDGIFKPGDRVVVADDLIATGGSAGAAGNLVRRQGGRVVGFSFLIELAGLKGAKYLAEQFDVPSLSVRVPTHSVLIYD